jgi:hypothetical protein
MDGNPLRDYLLILNPGKCGSTWLAKTLSVQPFLATRGELDFIFFLEYPLEKQWNRRTADDPAFLRIREDVRQSPLEKLVGLYRLQQADDLMAEEELCSVLVDVPNRQPLPAVCPPSV